VTRRLAALAAVLALAAAPSAPVGAAAGPTFSHLFVVVMENRSYAAAMGDPTIAAIARRGALFTNYYAVSHPSLPNYLALTGGSTFGIASDCVTCYVSANNLGQQLTAANVSWDAYLEGVPGPCFLDPYGGSDYAAKHNPFRYFDDVRSSRAACSHLRPLTDLAPTLARPAASVPRFVWVTPDLCHDGHDCSTPIAAAWLKSLVAEVTSSAAYRAGGALVITWDEGDGSAGLGASRRAGATGGGGRVPAIVLSTATTPGTRVGAARDHYSLLATVEDVFGLARLAHARGAATLSPAFNGAAAPTG
jgi:phosphatidylinositol-3-phosphatase